MYSPQQRRDSRRSNKIPWFWNLSSTSHKISFFIILLCCFGLFCTNLYFLVDHSLTTSYRSRTRTEQYDDTSDSMTNGDDGKGDKINQDDKLSMNTQNILSALFISGSILHFIILGIGIIGLVRSQYQWILGFIISWTIFLIGVLGTIFLVTGKFYLPIPLILLIIVFIMGTVTHAMLIKYPQTDVVSRGFAMGWF